MAVFKQGWDQAKIDAEHRAAWEKATAATLHVERGQVWDPRGEIAAGLTDGGLLVVRDVDPDFGIITFRTGVRANERALKPWRMVGFELDNGRRVMVGDEFERRGDGGRYRVSRLTLGGYANMEGVNGAWWVGDLVETLLDHGGPWRRVWTRAEVTATTNFATLPHAEATGAAEKARSIWISDEALGDAKEIGTTLKRLDRRIREEQRRSIDRLLAEDARACPEFATARLRAVMGTMEHRNGLLLAAVDLARDILAELHYYEAHRGGERRPRRDETRCLPAAVAEAVEVYERSRGLS